MKTIKKPQRISPPDLAGMAAQGVNRALAARETCLRELTPEEAAEVSGGATLKLGPGIIAGGRLENQLASALTTKMTNPAAGFDAAALGATMKGMV